MTLGRRRAPRARARCPRWLLASAALAATVALVACRPGRDTDAAAFRGVALGTPLARPAVVLTDTEGKPFDLVRETEDRVALLFFGYTHCPDVCPLHLANIAAVLRTMPFDERRQVRMLFVTVDPARDTPEVLRRYLDQFDQSFVGLVGPHEVVEELQRTLRVGVARREAALGASQDSSNYLVGHAAQVIAFSRDGLAHLLYPFGTRQDDWSRDLPRLVRGDAVRAPQLTVEAVPAPVTAGPPYIRAGSLTISNVVVAEPPTPDQAAMYFTIRNDGDAPDTLQTMQTDAAGAVTLHAQRGEGGMSAMAPLAALAIAPHETARLAPGGVHAMLVAVQRPLTTGVLVTASFTFARAGVVNLRATVVPYTALDSALGTPRGR